MIALAIAFVAGIVTGVCGLLAAYWLVEHNERRAIRRRWRRIRSSMEPE